MWPASSPWPTTSSTPWTCWTQRCGRTCSILTAPIRTKDQSNPSTYYGPDAKSIHSLVADGCFIEGEVENSILSRGVIVEAGAKVSNSVLMQGTIIRAGASLSYTITDKNVQVNQDRMLMGHSTYPLAISKDSIV